MGASRKFTFDELRDPWVLHYELGSPTGGPIPFPAARFHREVDRAARAIIAGRSPGVQGWLNRRIGDLARWGVEKEAARQDIENLKEAIEARIVRIQLTEGADAD
ncbi:MULTISPECIES: hypothetical protein [Agrobacterium]|uniref:hypothetical protein n=1 Tax=Agrobacterium TaxID=357 RepID=UPI0009BA4AB4|nr:hypothetical protein [Agrobacterium deltaense]MCA2378601.1 hypothetical protein [Agrobacterium tomkonis RTP8]CUX08667.1 hypothetical protein AGR7B_Cc10177 [Agrobacterium deltaense RV3]